MKTNYVLIDFENVQPASIAALDAEHFHVMVFCGANQTKVPLELAAALQQMGARGRYIQISGNGSNALDFHVAFYIGELATKDPAAFFHIISRDTGFDPLIAHLKSRKILAARSKTIEDMPIFKTPSVAGLSAPVGVPATARIAAPAPAIAKSAPAPKTASTSSTKSSSTLEKRISMAVKDLSGRGNSRPRTVKTLASTLHALLGKALSEAEIAELVDALAKQKHITIDGTKVIYSLKPAKS